MSDNPEWSSAIGAFFALYLKLGEADRPIVDELIHAVQARRRPVLERPDWSAGFPLRGRLTKLYEIGGDAHRYHAQEDTPADLMLRMVGAMHVLRDVVDRYTLTAEDLHDYRLADLRIGQVVAELRRRYGGARGADKQNAPVAKRDDFDAPRTSEQEQIQEPKVRADNDLTARHGAAVTPTAHDDQPKRKGRTWTDEQKAVQAERLRARYSTMTPEQRAAERQKAMDAKAAKSISAVERMQSMPKLNPAPTPPHAPTTP